MVHAFVAIQARLGSGSKGSGAVNLAKHRKDAAAWVAAGVVPMCQYSDVQTAATRIATQDQYCSQVELHDDDSVVM
jgi:hypothetical protein